MQGSKLALILSSYVTDPSWLCRMEPSMSHGCIHDGIDTSIAAPDEQVPPLALPDGTVVCRSEPVVTFVNRRVEPYRGCHTFLRALPRLQQL